MGSLWLALGSPWLGPLWAPWLGPLGALALSWTWPTATQEVDEVHETPLRYGSVLCDVSPAGNPRMVGVQVVPERVSAKSEPTATQEVAEVHATPVSDASVI